MKDMGGTITMIELKRLNGSPLAVNCDLIKYVEAAPDTVLTLTTGEKLIVLEPCSEVSQLILEYRAAVLRQAWPQSDPSLSPKLPRNAEAPTRTLDRTSSEK
jgi:flagellar protein FlbD